MRIDWKANYARNHPFSDFHRIFLATFNPCIFGHMKISYLMMKSADLKSFQDRSWGCRCYIAFFLNVINKCQHTIILKHLKDVGFCKIDCGRVNIPDKLRHSKRHVMKTSLSFSFNNQRSNKFPKYMFYRCALKASFFTN